MKQELTMKKLKSILNTVFRLSAILIILIILMGFKSAHSQSVDFDPDYYETNYFDLSDLQISMSEIYPANDERVGIPCIDTPQFMDASSMEYYLTDKDVVVILEHEKETRVYPLRFLSHHEVVSDEIQGQDFLITYSPITESVQVYEAKDFGMSAMVFNNNGLMYDRSTRSLWTQLNGKAIAGERSGDRLVAVPFVYTTWGAVKTDETKMQVLSTENGIGIDYADYAYARFQNSDELPYPLSYSKKILPLKEKVVGVEVDNKFKAYGFSLLEMPANGITEDYFNGMKLRIHYDDATKTVKVTDEENTPLVAAITDWYAWYVFHPKTLIYGFAPNKNPVAVLNNEKE